MRIIEIVLVLLSVLFAIMKVIAVPGGVVLAALSLFLLSLMYMIFGVALFNGVRFRRMFKATSYQDISRSDVLLGVIYGLVLSLGIFSILFNLMQWGGGGFLRYALLVPLLTVVILSIFVSDAKSALRKNVPWRAVAILLLNLFFVVKYYLMF